MGPHLEPALRFCVASTVTNGQINLVVLKHVNANPYRRGGPSFCSRRKHFVLRILANEMVALLIPFAGLNELSKKGKDKRHLALRELYDANDFPDCSLRNSSFGMCELSQTCELGGKPKDAARGVLLDWAFHFKRPRARPRKDRILVWSMAESSKILKMAPAIPG